MKKSTRNMSLSTEQAEETAIALLAWMASSPEHMARFLALSGLGPDDLRREAASRQFHIALLDYALSDESLLLAFCASANIPPAQIEPARNALNHEHGQNSNDS